MGLWFSAPQSDYQQNYPGEPTLSHEKEEGYGTMGGSGEGPAEMRKIENARNAFLAQKPNASVNSGPALSTFDTSVNRYNFQTDLSPPHF